MILTDRISDWDEFLAKLKATGGSTDMQTSNTGRYPWLFHFCRGEASQLTSVIVYAKAGIKSPPRDWSTREKILADYAALKENGGFFNDTAEALKEML